MKSKALWDKILSTIAFSEKAITFIVLFGHFLGCKVGDTKGEDGLVEN